MMEPHGTHPLASTRHTDRNHSANVTNRHDPYTVDLTPTHTVHSILGIAANPVNSPSVDIELG